jgi:hypothetical protein
MVRPGTCPTGRTGATKDNVYPPMGFLYEAVALSRDVSVKRKESGVVRCEKSQRIMRVIDGTRRVRTMVHPQNKTCKCSGY